MSSGETRSTYTADEIKAEVRDTIRQLSEMTKTEQNFDQFCQTVLNKVVKLTGAHGALLWQVNGDNTPAVTHKAASQSAESIAPNAQQHSSLVREVIGTEKSLGLSSESLEGEKSPVPYLMLFSPIYNRTKTCCGSLELLQRTEITKSAQEGYLRFLGQIAQLFPRWHEQQDLARLTQSADGWNNKLEYINEVHGSLDTKETAYAIANEARRLLGCDRVSFAKWNGRRCKITAISSQDRFDNRANVIRKLGYVATASVSADTPFWVIGDTEGLAPEAATKINDYLDESHCRTLAVIPLAKRPLEVPDLEMNKRLRDRPMKLGALVLEYFDSDVTEEEILETKKLIVSQAELSFDNARQHSEVFLLPLWRRLGAVNKWLFRDHFAKSMTALAALGLLVLALIFYQAPLKMKVDGVMHPTIRRNIFAKANGTIEEVFVSDNATVSENQPLLRIRDSQLEMALADVDAQIETAKSELQTVKRLELMDSRQTRPEEKIGLTGRRQAAENTINSLEARKRLLEDKQQFLNINSPIEGEVITWDANRRLKELPVKYGQFVMSVEKTDGPWELELKIPENKVGYVTRALQANDGKPLTVEFIVGIDANAGFEGELLRIAQRAEVSESGNREFRAIVRADVSEMNPDDLRPGAGVTAKIQCGRQPMGFVWFHQIYDYLRTNLFF